MSIRKPRKIAVTKINTDPPAPVFTWAFKSSRAYGGTVVQYITQLNQDSTLSCNCPGWVFAKKGFRECKHTKSVAEEAVDIYKAWRKGEKLQVLEEEAPQIKTAAPKKKADESASKIKYGRFVSLD